MMEKFVFILAAAFNWAAVLYSIHMFLSKDVYIWGLPWHPLWTSLGISGTLTFVALAVMMTGFAWLELVERDSVKLRFCGIRFRWERGMGRGL